MSAPASPRGPFRRLLPFSEEDAPFFFGRDAERDTLTSNLLGSRLTLVFGPSGVGKSSLLNAGVAHGLRQFAARELGRRRGLEAALRSSRRREALAAGGEPRFPEFIVAVCRSWEGKPALALAACVGGAVAALAGGSPPAPPDPSLPLAQQLRAYARHTSATLLIILDQFEDYFLHHPGDDSFPPDLADAVNRPDLRANFLISIREDALARMELFKEHIPGVYANLMRLGHLTRETAAQAINCPLEELSEAGGVKIEAEPRLVEEVLDRVEVGQLWWGGAALPPPGTAAGGCRLVEAPYLQLVMSYVWDEEMRLGSRTLRLETLNGRLGGAARIVENHLHEVMSKRLSLRERDVAARAFKYLVTPSGAKTVLNLRDISYHTGDDTARLRQTLDKLTEGDARILRPVNAPRGEPEMQSYELFIDGLGPAVLAWRSRYLQAQYVGLGGSAVISGYLILLCLLLLYSLLQLALGPKLDLGLAGGPPVTFITWSLLLSEEARMFLVAAAAGAFGSVLGALRAAFREIKRRELAWRWVLQYLLLPFLGASLGVIFTLLLRGMFFSPGAATAQTNPYGFVALAVLVGMGSSQILDKLSQLAVSLFGGPEEVRQATPSVWPAPDSAAASLRTTRPGPGME